MPCCNLAYYIVVQAVSSVSKIGFNPSDAVDWFGSVAFNFGKCQGLVSLAYSGTLSKCR